MLVKSYEEMKGNRRTIGKICEQQLNRLYDGFIA